MLNSEKELFCNFQEDHPLAARVSFEIVNGKNSLSGLGKAVSIFGGAKAKVDSFEYLQSYKLAYELGKMGVSVISGGGPGVMEAANKGTKDAKHENAKAIGLNINIKAEKNSKEHQDISIYFEHFASRKIIFCAKSDAFVVSPGGFGTLDELFEVLTLMQTHKSKVVPIILLGYDFWYGLMDWVKSQMVHKGLLSEEHFNYITIANNYEEVLEILKTNLNI